MVEQTSFEEQVNFITKSYNDEIPESELKRIRPDVIKMAYDYLFLLQSEQYSDQQIRENQDKIKNQLKTIVDGLKLEEKKTNHNEYSSTSSEKKKIFETNKKRIHQLFLDMFYDYFILFENNWSTASDDNKKKDHFRFLKEKLQTIIIKGDGTIKKLNELSESDKQTVRDMIQNSFVDEDDNYIIPQLYKDTNEMKAYIRYNDEILSPTGVVGGRVKNTYKKRSRRKSATKSRSPRHHRRRRTSRK